MRIGCSEKTIGCDVARHRGEREMCQQLTARRQTIPRKMNFSKKETLSSRVLVWGEEKEPVSLWKTEVQKKKKHCGNKYKRIRTTQHQEDKTQQQPMLWEEVLVFKWLRFTLPPQSLTETTKQNSKKKKKDEPARFFFFQVHFTSLTVMKVHRKKKKH